MEQKTWKIKDLLSQHRQVSPARVLFLRLEGLFNLHRRQRRPQGHHSSFVTAAWRGWHVTPRPGRFSRAIWTTQSGWPRWGHKSSEFGGLWCGTTRTPLLQYCFICLGSCSWSLFVWPISTRKPMGMLLNWPCWMSIWNSTASAEKDWPVGFFTRSLCEFGGWQDIVRLQGLQMIILGDVKTGHWTTPLCQKKMITSTPKKTWVLQLLKLLKKACSFDFFQEINIFKKQWIG